MFGAQLIPLGAGLLSAVLHLSTVTGSPAAIFLAYFAQLPLAATGLALGFMPAAVAAAVASIAVALAGELGGSLTLFLLVWAAPVLLVVHFALQNRPGEDGTAEWYPIGRILGWLTAFCLVLFALALVGFAGHEGGLQGAIGDYLRAILRPLMQSDPAALDKVVARLTPLTPGYMAISWFVMTLSNCVLAQRLLGSAGKNIRPMPSYRDLEIVTWPAIVAVIGAILTFFGGNLRFVGFGAVIVALVPFFFIGLAVLHSISAAWPGRPLLLAGVYILLVLLLWPAAIVALLGIAEKWVNFRGRAKASRTNKGND